jgi:CRISPR-associated protein Csm2
MKRREYEITVADRIRKKIESLEGNLGDRFSPEDLVSYAEEFGKYLRSIYLKTSQIRRFLDAVNKIKATTDPRSFDRAEVVLLKPKLAYAAGRQDQVRPLAEVLTVCIDKVKEYKDFKRFAQFLEAIIAYHKYYGGREM